MAKILLNFNLLVENKLKEFKMKDVTPSFSPLKKMNNLIDNVNGRVGVPILLYFMGVPGFFVILIWLFFFRGK